MKLITVRPKTDALRHYLELEAECKNATPPADTRGRPVSGLAFQSTAGGAAELNNTLRDIAMRCAHFEARHQGPFNHSGKELNTEIVK